MLQCCTTLNKWKDPIGNVCIYDIMGPTPRRYRGDDEEEWGDDAPQRFEQGFELLSWEREAGVGALRG